jgi:NOL1/NOP2/fmu family ribosome biogenesis protein
MENELYHVDEVKQALRKLNPHLGLKEYRKNQSNFTVDFVLTLAEHQTKVEVPMDLFRDYDRGGKEDVEERLQQGYVLLLRKLEDN